MKSLYDLNLVVHAVCGAIALTSLVVPLATKKGGRAHRAGGRVFVWAMVGISVTGLLMSLAFIGFPLRVKPPPSSASPEQVPAAAEGLRAYGVFFGTLGILTGAAVWHGLSALRLKHTPVEHWARASDHLAYLLTAGAGALLLALGLAQSQMLFVGFGALALWGGLDDARFVRQPPTAKGTWLIRHLQSMLGGATAALTAFCVLALRRYLADYAAFELWFWFVPVTLGLGASVAWTRVYRRRLG